MTGLVLTLKGELGVDCCDGRAHCGHTDRHDATSDRAGGVWAGVGLDCTAVYSSLVYSQLAKVKSPVQQWAALERRQGRLFSLIVKSSPVWLINRKKH